MFSAVFGASFSSNSIVIVPMLVWIIAILFPGAGLALGAAGMVATGGVLAGGVVATGGVLAGGLLSAGGVLAAGVLGGWFVAGSGLLLHPTITNAITIRIPMHKF